MSIFFTNISDNRPSISIGKDTARKKKYEYLLLTLYLEIEITKISDFCKMINF